MFIPHNLPFVFILQMYKVCLQSYCKDLPHFICWAYSPSFSLHYLLFLKDFETFWKICLRSDCGTNMSYVEEEKFLNIKFKLLTKTWIMQKAVFYLTRFLDLNLDWHGGTHPPTESNTIMLKLITFSLCSQNVNKTMSAKNFEKLEKS